MSTIRAVRHINESRALAALLRQGGMSRADLARELGVTRATASSIVSSLAEIGFVEDETDMSAEREKRTGRPGTMVRLRADHAIFLGADIAIDHISLAAIDMNAKIIAQDRIACDCARLPLDDLCALIGRQICKFTQRLASPDAVQGLNVVVPGPVDQNGNVVRAPLLGWQNVPLRRLLAAHLGSLPVTNLENDANAFAIAEMHRSRRNDLLDAVYLFIEDGVGGCIVNGGNLLRGHDGSAGEMGHIIVGDGGFLASALIKGSLEGYVSRPALLARYQFHGGQAASLVGFLAALANDERSARLAASDWSHYLGRGLATLVSVVNPERIVLGGQAAAVFAHTRAEVQASIRAHLLPGAKVTPIDLSTMGDEAPAFGAALMHHRQFFAIDNALVFGAGAS